MRKAATKHVWRLIAVLVCMSPVFLMAAQNTATQLDRCNVVWTEPSADSAGSMPIGNGDVGLNVWVERNGVLRFYISKTDSFSGLGRLLKLGGVRLQFDPDPLASPEQFQQTLNLQEGVITVQAQKDGFSLEVRIWVDACNPAVHVECRANRPYTLQADLDVWRRKARLLKAGEANSARGIAGGPVPLHVEPDTILPPEENRLVWYHHNTRSIWADTMRHQGAAGLLSNFTDPLKDRIFGAAMEGTGLKAVSADRLTASSPRMLFVLSIYPLTMHPAKPDAWHTRLFDTIERIKVQGLDKAFAGHTAWWRDFWNRSWIYVTRSRKRSRSPPIEANSLPLRIGADANGGSRFKGDIAGVWIYGGALSPEAVGYLAEAGEIDLDLPVPRAAWTFAGDATFPLESLQEKDLKANAAGEVKILTHSTSERPLWRKRGAGTGFLRLDGRGFLEVPHDARLNLDAGCTLTAWIKPGKLPAAGCRIIDKIPVGGADGYLLDTYPGNSLRLIVPAGTLNRKNCLPEDKWSHVAGTYCRKTGEFRLYVNGRQVAAGSSADAGDEAAIVSQGYALQRWINACGGRGGLPIKFNGSIFTVDAQGFDADYRRWGGMFWWQNTRLPYWSMPAAGDIDLMRPLFSMYMNALPLRKAVTKLYYGHAGAFYPETQYFFGMPGNCDHGWKRGNAPDREMLNRYIRREWQGGIELIAMMQDVYERKGDERFLSETLLSFSDAILLFYEQHYPRDEKGKLYIHPGQALETWQDASNPMPELAGLRWVLGRFLAWPETTIGDARRRRWRTLLDSVPPLPKGERAGEPILLPAQRYGKLGNIENPELYCIFPYRFFGVGKDDLPLARRTFENRRVKGSRGWQQDPVQAALLGLTDEARRFVVHRFATKHGGSRFPAFWGPNFDWIPDQDHGGIAMTALQAMLLQCEGRRMRLLPAWPEDWDVDFKLHAPINTTVEGRYENGRLVRVTVSPQSRARDLEIME